MFTLINFYYLMNSSNSDAGNHLGMVLYRDYFLKNLSYNLGHMYYEFFIFLNNMLILRMAKCSDATVCKIAFSASHWKAGS